MIVASSSVAGKTDRLLTLAQDLGDFVRQAVQQGASFDDLERGTLRRILQMGPPPPNFSSRQGNGDLGETVTTEDGAILHAVTPESRPCDRSSANIAFTASSIPRAPTENRTAAHRRPPQSARRKGVLSVRGVLATVLRRESVRRGGPAVAGGVPADLSVNVLEDINRTMGEQAERFLEQLPKPPAKTEGDCWSSPRTVKECRWCMPKPSRCRFSTRRNGPAIAAWPRWAASTRWIRTCARPSRLWRPCSVTTR